MKKVFTLIALAAGFAASAQHSVYIDNRSDWATVKLYAWGADDAPEILGGWPGAEPSSTVTVNGVDYLKFDTPASANGMTYNFIANDGIDGGAQFDLASITLDKDYYYAINGKVAVSVDPQNPGDVVFPTAEDYTVYVDDQSGWSVLKIYAWATGLPELFGGWSGAEPSGSVVIEGTAYKTFAMSGNGERYNLIFNDGTDANKIEGVSIAVNRDYYFHLTSTACEEIPAPGAKEYYVYVEDKTGWDDLCVYAWGDEEVFGGWPGAHSSGVTEKDGVSYLSFKMIGNGQSVNLIFNDGKATEATQYDVTNITVDRDYYFVAEPDRATTGVDSVIAADDENVPAEYFNLQGQRVDNPTAGIYLVRRGSEVAKVLVK